MEWPPSMIIHPRVNASIAALFVAPSTLPTCATAAADRPSNCNDGPPTPPFPRVAGLARSGFGSSTARDACSRQATPNGENRTSVKIGHLDSEAAMGLASGHQAAERRNRTLRPCSADKDSTHTGPVSLPAQRLTRPPRGRTGNGHCIFCGRSDSFWTGGDMVSFRGRRSRRQWGRQVAPPRG